MTGSPVHDSQMRFLDLKGLRSYNINRMVQRTSLDKSTKFLEVTYLSMWSERLGYTGIIFNSHDLTFKTVVTSGVSQGLNEIRNQRHQWGTGLLDCQEQHLSRGNLDESPVTR